MAVARSVGASARTESQAGWGIEVRRDQDVRFVTGLVGRGARGSGARDLEALGPMQYVERTEDRW